jgi:aerobic carbon-monoxide dehydrogenase medium subunit
MDVDETGVCLDARLALTGVNPAPLLVPQASQLLAGRKASGELIEQVAYAAIQTAKPLTTSASTPVYRREMVKLFTRRALEEAWGAQDGGGRVQ